MHNHRKILIPNWVWDSKNKDEFKSKLSKYMKQSVRLRKESYEMEEKNETYS